MHKWSEQTSKDDYRTEQARLEGQHEVLIHHMGRAVYAPIDFTKRGQRILDSGCASGKWLIDLQGHLPAKHHEFIGTDINDKIFPSPPPDLMHFQKQDIREDFPEEWKGTFTFVHQRLTMFGAAPGTPEPVIKRLAELLKPGAWMQLVEVDPAPLDENGPMMAQVLRILKTLLATSGVGVGAAEFKDLMVQAGLVDVQEKPVMISYGRAINRQDLKEKSIVSACAAVAPMINVLKALPNDFKDEELDGFEGRLRKELEEQGGFMKFWW